MTTRSARLFTAVLPVAYNTPLYVAPPGTVVLFKSLYAYTEMSGTEQLVIKVQEPLNGNTAWVFSFAAAGPANGTWEGWVVLEPGDVIVGDLTGGLATVWGSGALLPVGST